MSFHFFGLELTTHIKCQNWSRHALLPFPSLRVLYILSMYLLSHVQLFTILWTVARQAPLSMGFSRQDNWNGLPSPPPGDLPDPGIEPGSLALAGGFFTLWATREACRNQSVASLISSWLLVFPWKAPPLYITCLFSFSVPTHTIKFCLKCLSKPVLKSRRSHQQFPGALGISQMLSEWLRQEKLPRLSVQRHCFIFCVHSSVSHLKHSPSVFKRNFQ